MAGGKLQIVTGELLEETRLYDLEFVCRSCGVAEETVVELVAEGVVEPEDGDRRHWRFTGTAVRRAQVAVRLTRELDVNLAGAALALDLLDEIERLRRRLRRMG